MEPIQLVAPALRSARFVALGEANRTVNLVGLEPPRHISTLDTVLDFGGDRLALCETRDGLIIVAAAWERHGVCAYEPGTGRLLWQRKDLKRPQTLSPAGDGGYVAVGLDGRSMRVLDATTGQAVTRIRAAETLWQSPHLPLAATASRDRLSLLDTQTWSRRWSASVDGFAILDVAFAPDALLAADTRDSEAAGSCRVYAFDLAGSQEWSLPLPERMVCWAVGWDASADTWLGVAHDVDRAGPDSLLRWSRTGETLARHAIPSGSAVAFMPGGRSLVTESGVVDTATGRSTSLPRW